MARITQTVGVRRRVPGGVPDRYGTPVPAWAPPEEIGVYAVAPRAASDDSEPRVTGRPELTVTGLTIYAPRDIRISSGDRVDVYGETWEVVGLPALWENSPVGGFMFRGGIVVNVEKVAG